MTTFSEPRELTASERALLTFLLTADFPGRDELLQQARKVKATGDCDCGCGTIDLVVESNGPRATVREPVPVEAWKRGTGAVDVMLFVRNGLLSMLEVVDYDTDHPSPYPKPEDLELWVPPR